MNLNEVVAKRMAKKTTKTVDASRGTLPHSNPNDGTQW